jgi:hypothetical protein
MGLTASLSPVDDILPLLLPGVNWLALLGAITMAPKNIGVIQGAFAFWVVVGFVIYALL